MGRAQNTVGGWGKGCGGPENLAESGEVPVSGKRGVAGG